MARIETKGIDTEANKLILVGGEKPITYAGNPDFTTAGKVVFSIYGVADVFPLTVAEAREMAALLNSAASQVE